MIKYFFIAGTILLSKLVMAQSGVGIGTPTPHSSAALEINASTKGLLIPSMSDSQRSAINNPANGLMVYDSSNKAHYFFNDTRWLPIGASLYNTNYNLAIGSSSVVSYNMGAASSSSNNMGILYDNGNTGNYGNNRNDIFTITTAGSLGIILELQEMNTELFYDSLLISVNGNTWSYTGTQTDTISIMGLSTNVVINFKSNAVNTAPGFKLGWKKIYTNSNPYTSYDSTQLAGWYYNSVKNYMRGGLNANNNWHPDSCGVASFSYGYKTQAKSDYAIALGDACKALTYASCAIGFGNTAEGYNSLALGSQTKARGSFSTSSGTVTLAKSYAGFVAGLYNDTAYTAFSGSASSSNRLFEIGNGSSESSRSNALTVLQNGNVGLGTVTPSQNLSVQKGVNIDNENSNDGSLLNALRFGSASGEAIASRRTAGANQYGIDVYTNNIKRLSVAQNGNIGIGTDAPTQNLTIQKGMNIDNENSNDGTLLNALRFGNNSTGEAIACRRTAGTNQYGFDFYTNNISRMTISNAGNIGIGTNTPAVPLQFANNAGNKISFFQNGVNYYGIGTQANKLQLYTPTASDKIVLGYGNSGAMTENVTINGSGSMDVKTDITVQNGKGIIRNNSSVQLKQIVTNALVNPSSIGGLSLHTQAVTWSEVFGSTPLAAFVGNQGGSGWAELIISISNVTTTGCTLYVYNPRNVSVSPNFNINIITLGPQ